MENLKLETLTPIGHRVLILPDPSDEKTKGGVIIPDAMRKISLIGTVIKAGKGDKNKPMKVSVGDKVMYPRAVREKKWNIEGKDYLFCIQQDLILRVKQ